MDFALREFLQVENCRFEFAADDELLEEPIAGVSIDTRTIAPKQVYFALKGENHDGHDFVPDAFKQKALAAVVEERWWRKHKTDYSEKPIFIVVDTLVALQESARSQRGAFVINLTSRSSD